jgi:hypothetical protein
MTEAEWLYCTDPLTMIQHLHGNVSHRKLRLFTLACCRRIWHLLEDERSRQAVEAAEQFVDGSIDLDAFGSKRILASDAQIALARASTPGSDDETDTNDEWDRADYVVKAAKAAHYASNWLLGIKGIEAMMTPAQVCELKATTLEVVAVPAAMAVGYRTASTMRDPPWTRAVAVERYAQLHLLRDILGNPFRPAAIDPAWLRVNDQAVQRIAQQIYEERRFADMPILADALEEAGCGEDHILDHCRKEREHARGCWLVDLILSKDR